MTRALGVTMNTDNFLDFDTEFYSAGYSRARMFERQLATFLERKFGLNWWKNKKVGEFLSTYYRNARKYNAEEILKEMGIGDSLDFDFYYRWNVSKLRDKNF